MTALAHRDDTTVDTYITDDPTGGRLIAWAQAASAANQLAKALVTTSFVPAAFKGNVGDATAAVLMGDELGLSPLASLRSIFVIHGTPAMYARTMVALAQSRGHEIWTEVDTPDKVIVCGRRRGSDKVERSEWTIARARKAGYTNNKKYESQPQEMLYAKAASTVARKVAADVLAGVPFSIEDIELEEPEATTPAKRGGTTKAQRAPLEAVPEPELEPTPRPIEDVPLPLPETQSITRAQQTKIMACYGDLDLAGDDCRDDRLADTSAVVGRDVTSTNELSKAEAHVLIESLEARVQRVRDEAGQGAE